MPFVALVLTIATIPSRAVAQMSSDTMAHPHGHIAPFTEGHEGGLFGTPHFDLNAGVWHTSGTTDAAVRMHLQYSPGSMRHVEIAWDLLFLPARGATPNVSAVVQLAPLAEGSRFYVNAGAGLITGHSASGDRLTGWLEGTAAWRSPLHDVTPFVQVGHGTGGGNKFEFLFGLAHPLSPYHAPRHS